MKKTPKTKPVSIKNAAENVSSYLELFKKESWQIVFAQNPARQFEKSVAVRKELSKNIDIIWEAYQNFVKQNEPCPRFITDTFNMVEYHLEQLLQALQEMIFAENWRKIPASNAKWVLRAAAELDKFMDE